MKSEQEILDALSILRKDYFNRNVLSQEYFLDGQIIKSCYSQLEWVLGKKYCLTCGKEHNNIFAACSKKCGEKIYG